MNNQEKYQYIKNRIVEIFNRTTPPEKEAYLDLLKKTNALLTTENNKIRPYDNSGLPGGIVILKPNIPTIIVSDIHARLDYIMSILFNEDILKYTILEKLALDMVQIVCVGDGVHAESRAAKRWTAAFEEYKNGYIRHANIDDEMRESFGVMEMIMELKNLFPNNFHFLKGNHENITNEKGGGNHPFMKFAHEGPMVDYYVKKFYGEETSREYYNFEKNMPIFSIGKNFLISHAEPRKFFSYESIVEYRNNPEVILGLTWTDDDASEEGSVDKMLNTYIDADYLDGSCYFGGHRPVKDKFNPRANGKFIQIHNPNKFIIATIPKDQKINVERDITVIDKKIKLGDDFFITESETRKAATTGPINDESKIDDTAQPNESEAAKTTETVQAKEETKTQDTAQPNDSETAKTTETVQAKEETKTEDTTQTNDVESTKTTESEQLKEEKTEDSVQVKDSEITNAAKPEQSNEETKRDDTAQSQDAVTVNDSKPEQAKEEIKTDGTAQIKDREATSAAKPEQAKEEIKTNSTAQTKDRESTNTTKPKQAKEDTKTASTSQIKDREATTITRQDQNKKKEIKTNLSNNTATVKTTKSEQVEEKTETKNTEVSNDSDISKTVKPAHVNAQRKPRNSTV